jgi:hypothetical protein
MNDLSEIDADAFFDGKSSNDTAPATTVDPDQAIADLLYGKPAEPKTPQAQPGDPLFVPSHIKAARDALRKSDPAASMFGNSTPDLDITDLLTDDNPSANTDQLVAMSKEVSTVLTGDLGLGVLEAKEGMNLMRQVNREPPTAQKRGEWAREGEARLQAKYGADWREVANWARRVATHDPRVAASLNRHGLGDHPDVIMKFAELGVRARSQGKLR